MNHFSCDGCQRMLDPEHDVHYVVRMEVYAVLEDGDEPIFDADRDRLQETQDDLDRFCDSEDAEPGHDTYYGKSFDLCGPCREKFLRDPLGRRLAAQFDFSKN